MTVGLGTLKPMKTVEQLVSDEAKAAQAQLNHRRRLGDDLTKIRPVDHNLVFQDLTSAKAAEAELAGKGFTAQLWQDQKTFLDVQN